MMQRKDRKIIVRCFYWRIKKLIR